MSSSIQRMSTSISPTISTLPSELLVSQIIPLLNPPPALVNLASTNHHFHTLCLPEFKRRVLSRDVPAADQLRFRKPEGDAADRMTDEEFQEYYVAFVRRVCRECWRRKGATHVLWEGKSVCEKCQRGNDRYALLTLQNAVDRYGLLESDLAPLPHATDKIRVRAKNHRHGKTVERRWYLVRDVERLTNERFGKEEWEGRRNFISGDGNGWSREDEEDEEDE